MRRSTGVVFALLLMLLLGLSMQPDDGTAVSRPEGVGVEVDGANHAKPLPRPTTADDLLPLLTIAVGIAIAVTAVPVVRLPRTLDAPPPPELRSSRAVARRGPPALV